MCSLSQGSFSHISKYNFPSTSCWKNCHFPHWIVLALLWKINWLYFIWVYFWAFYSIALCVCSSSSTTLSWLMDVHNVLQLGSVIPSISFFFFKIVLYPSSFAFPIFRISFLYLQKFHWGSYWNYVKSRDQYGKNLLFYYVGSSDP